MDRVILVALLGLGGVAIYGAAAKITKAFHFALAAFVQAWRPFAMVIIQTPERNEIYRRVLNYYAGVSCGLGLLVTALSPELLLVLVPSEYHQGYVVVPWLIGAAALHRSSAVTHLGILLSEKTAIESVISLLGVTINVALSLCLVPVLGVVGAAIGVFGGELVFTCLLAWFSSRESDLRFDWRIVLSVLLCFILASALLLLVQHLVPGPLSLVLRVAVLALALGSIGYLTIGGNLLFPRANRSRLR
jgi:O-antigen/teichoic acid export membrane protein